MNKHTINRYLEIQHISYISVLHINLTLARAKNFSALGGLSDVVIERYNSENLIQAEQIWVHFSSLLNTGPTLWSLLY